MGLAALKKRGRFWKGFLTMVRRHELLDYMFTSESVSEGHPDKVCDQISDAILDAYLTQDPYTRVAVETLATTNRVIVAGEVKGPEISKKRIEEIIRQEVKRIGYAQEGFHWEKLKVEVLIHPQSADIAQGVDNKEKRLEGAGDQGLMFGYATNETEALMPAAIHYSHQILREIFADIRSGKLKGLGPDAKSQVTLWYEDDKPAGAKSVVVSIQHPEGMTQKEVRSIIRPYVEKVLPKGWMPEEKDLYINPTGKFVIGGPDGDAGLTGRKIIVDTYGGYAPHGGGAFSGKDPTKVDRSAAYFARYLAKNVVGLNLAKACTVQLAYAIGVAKPLSLYINTHGTGELKDEELMTKVWERIDLTPWGIRERLKLHNPIYHRTAAYGHFGRAPDRDGGFTWERVDLGNVLKA
jgi:S-adenosylmethionine synthetase